MTFRISSLFFIGKPVYRVHGLVDHGGGDLPVHRGTTAMGGRHARLSWLHVRSGAWFLIAST
jgi:hypothetical protein